jgi:hypothetical protein
LDGNFIFFRPRSIGRKSIPLAVDPWRLLGVWGDDLAGLVEKNLALFRPNNRNYIVLINRSRCFDIQNN